jgi:hypothetical protein
MHIKDRIKELRRVPASDLLPNPKNWRTHPTAQVDSLKGILAEVGWADAVLARETPDGLLLIDGHARSEIAPDQEIPVLILDVDEREADLILATLDPLAAMATTNQAALDALLAETETQCAALAEMLEKMASKDDQGGDSVPPDKFEVIVECESEAEQKQVYEQMIGEGFECRVLTF